VAWLLQVPVEVQDGNVAVPVEALFVVALGLLGWLFKWLIGREFKRFEEIQERHDRAIEVLQKSDQAQQFDLTQVGRLEAGLAKAQEDLAAFNQALAQLARLPETVGDLQAANGQLSERIQRLDNVGFALKQTQELLQQCQRDTLAVRTEMATAYVSDEKYVREMTMIASKMDAVWERVDALRGRHPRYLEGGQ